jgi:hypothetical protein
MDWKKLAGRIRKAATASKQRQEPTIGDVMQVPQEDFSGIAPLPQSLADMKAMVAGGYNPGVQQSLDPFVWKENAVRNSWPGLDSGRNPYLQPHMAYDDLLNEFWNRRTGNYGKRLTEYDMGNPETLFPGLQGRNWDPMPSWLSDEWLNRERLKARGLIDTGGR